MNSGEGDSSVPLRGIVCMHDRRVTKLHRRSFLGFGAAAAAGSLVPSSTYAAVPATTPKAPERILSFFNTHTGERVRSAVCLPTREGVYLLDTLHPQHIEEGYDVWQLGAAGDAPEANGGHCAGEAVCLLWRYYVGRE